MDIIGKKAVNEDGPSEDDLTDRDLASPQFVSWVARREVRHLRDVVNALPDLSGLKPLADEAVRVVDEIDDAISGWSQ